MRKPNESRERILEVLKEPCTILEIVEKAGVTVNIARKAIRHLRGEVRICGWIRTSSRHIAIYQVGLAKDEPPPEKYQRTYANRKSRKIAVIEKPKPNIKPFADDKALPREFFNAARQTL